MKPLPRGEKEFRKASWKLRCPHCDAGAKRPCSKVSGERMRLRVHKSRLESLEALDPRPCLECSKTFQPSIRQRVYHKFCSKRCALVHYRSDAREMRERNTLRKYGLDHTAYDKILEEQRGQCRICGKKPKTRQLNIDHSHTTGVVRGLLCAPCNGNLGWFEANYSAALKYLEKVPTYVTSAQAEAQERWGVWSVTWRKRKKYRPGEKERERMSGLTNFEARKLVSHMKSHSTKESAEKFGIGIRLAEEIYRKYREGRKYAGATLRGAL